VIHNDEKYSRDLAIELQAIPKMNSCLPKTIDFGNVNIGMRLV